MSMEYQDIDRFGGEAREVVRERIKALFTPDATAREHKYQMWLEPYLDGMERVIRDGEGKPVIAEYWYVCVKCHKMTAAENVQGIDKSDCPGREVIEKAERI